MKHTDVIILGGGAAGLMAAYTLLKAGKTVTVLEARNRLGGRIHTNTTKGFSMPVELGAEFVHGNLPVTLEVLEEAGIGTSKVTFEMWQSHSGKFEQSVEFVEGWDAFLEKVNQLQTDMPLHDFLDQNYNSNDHAKMLSQIENYVAGYDTADTKDVSTFALRNEWNHEDEDAQHRINGGYGKMIDYLADVCRSTGNLIHLNTVANEVLWENNRVKVSSSTGIYNADKLIIALPLGVLQESNKSESAIKFYPPLSIHQQAIQNMGFGSVIKIVLEFDDIFWESDTIKQKTGSDLSTMGFLFASEKVPTFWTQAPHRTSLLTGWIGGIPAYEMKDMTEDEILDETITSLSSIFGISTQKLKQKLLAWHVANWTTEHFTRGSYAYDKPENIQARSILQHPVKDTLYFAGEYLYNGPAMGTVEAALTSGKNAAKKILET